MIPRQNASENTGNTINNGRYFELNVVVLGKRANETVLRPMISIPYEKHFASGLLQKSIEIF